MQTKFTPGPWTLGPWIDSLGGNVYRVVSAPGRRVSSVTVYGRRTDGTTGGRALKGGGHAKTVDDAEVEANGQLIAAAPALYEALSAVLPYLEEGYMADESDDEPVGWTADSDGQNQRPLPLTFGMVRRARAAVKLARGEA